MLDGRNNRRTNPKQIRRCLSYSRSRLSRCLVGLRGGAQISSGTSSLEDQGLRDNRSGSGLLWPCDQLRRLADRAGIKEPIPSTLEVKNRNLHTPMPSGRLLSQYLWCGFKYPEHCTALRSLKERWSIWMLFLLWDKGIQKTSSFSRLRIFSQPRAFGGFYANGWKEKLGSKWPLLEGSVFQNRETDQIWKKGICIFFKMMVPLSSFHHIFVILVIVCWFSIVEAKYSARLGSPNKELGGIMKKIVFVCLGNICRTPWRSLTWKTWRISMRVKVGPLLSWEHGNPIHQGTQKIFQRHQVPESAKTSLTDQGRGFLQLWFDPRDGRKQCSRSEGKWLLQGQNTRFIFLLLKVCQIRGIPVILRETYSRVLSGCKAWLDQLATS